MNYQQLIRQYSGQKPVGQTSTCHGFGSPPGFMTFHPPPTTAGVDTPTARVKADSRNSLSKKRNKRKRKSSTNPKKARKKKSKGRNRERKTKKKKAPKKRKCGKKKRRTTSKRKNRSDSVRRSTVKRVLDSLS